MVRQINETTWFDSEFGVRFVWNGAHTVNCFNGNSNFDCFSIGDFSLNSATPEQVLQGINNYIAYSLNDNL